MKHVLVFFSALIFMIPVTGQTKKQQYFSFVNSPVRLILPEIESKFDVKYSFADSLIDSASITLKPDQYTLEEVHREIESQLALKVVSIDGRFYSLTARTELPAMSEQLPEILVEGMLSKGIQKGTQYTIIQPAKLSVLPGVTDADVLLSLQQLPGVKSPNETATGLYIRGGTPDQNLVLWDGIRIYHPGHLFGMISAFNPSAVQKVFYGNKGTHPKYGEKISSVIDIRSLDSIPVASSISAGFNGLNADFVVQAPLVDRRLGVQVSGRKSFTENWQSPTFDALAQKVFQNTNFERFDQSNRFGFEDYSAKLNVDLTRKSRLSLSGIWIDNNLDFSALISETQKRTQVMEIRNKGFSGQWDQQYGNRFKQEVLCHYSEYGFAYDKNDSQPDANFERFEKRNRVVESGLETRFEWRLSNKIVGEFGYSLRGSDVSHSFTSSNRFLEIDLNQKRLFFISHHFFGNANFTHKSWKSAVGMRMQSIPQLNTVLSEPRFTLQKKLSERFTGQFTFERKHQILTQFRESVTNDLSLENYIWILADNQQYPIQRGDQFTAGIMWKDRNWLFDFDAYHRSIRGITSLTFGFLNPTDSALHRGQGFVNGLDFLLQRSSPNWKAWVTYSYQDARNKFDGINENSYFDVNANVRHALSCSFYRKWNAFDVAAGWFWRSGKPYSVLNSNNQIASLNSEQLPSYHRLDVSATYQFRSEKNWSGKFGISVYNLYNRRATLSREYERNYSALDTAVNSGFVVREYNSLGRMPNIFLKVTF